MAQVLAQNFLETCEKSFGLFLGGIALAFGAYIVYNAIYNRYFHPLSKFPGPFLGSITQFYLVYVIASVPTFGLELHRKYGPIVRLAPNLLSFSDPNVLPIVYHRNADKPTFYGSWMFGNTAAMFQSLAHRDHAAKKRVVAPCCSLNAMKLNHESKISERIDELCVKLRERSADIGQPLDFSEHLRWFLSDTWSHLVYGVPMGWVARGEDVKGLLAALQGVYSMSASAAVMPWLMPILRSPWWRKHILKYTKTFKHMDNLYSHFEEMIDRRQHDDKLKQAHLFFDDLNPSLNPHEFQFSREDLKAEVITFTAATLDGAAAAISPCMDNILQNPEIHQRIVEEIVAADKAGKLSHPVASYDETTQLPFFMACMKETLRRDAPAQTILPRLVSDPGYHLPDGSYVPKGMQMGASPFIIHHDQAVFGPNPEKFHPARWLPGEGGPGVTEESVKRMERLGMWWGYGDRECAGKAYAQMEMQKLLVELFRRFEITSAPAPGGSRFIHQRWAVGMFWGQRLLFSKRKES